MKKILLPALLISNFAYANIADLNFVAPAKRKSVNVNYTSYTAFHGVEAIDATKDTETTTEKKQMQAAIAYGISNKWSVEVILTSRLSHVVTTDVINYTTNPTSTTSTELDYDTVGLEDPVIMAGYRTYKENDLVVDLNFGALLGLMTRDSDNAYRGGHILKVNAEVSKKVNNLELYANLALDLNLEAEDKDGNTAEESSQDTKVLLQGQYNIFKGLYLNLGMAIDTIGSKGDNSDAYNINSKIVGIKYAFNDSAVANVEYRIIESDLLEDTVGIYDEEQSQVSLGVKFNF